MQKFFLLESTIYAKKKFKDIFCLSGFVLSGILQKLSITLQWSEKEQKYSTFKDGHVDGSLTNLLRTDLNYIEKYIYDSAFLKNKSCGLDKANNASYALLAKVGQTYLALEEYK